MKIRENLLFRSIWHIVYHRWEKRVLLVDTDMRKSVLQRRMGLEGVKLGLSEYLSGNAELGQVIYDVGIPNMHVLFSGKLVPNASALLSAKWLENLCAEVRDSMIMLFLIHLRFA